jgi:hypothetical protein
MRAKFIFEKFKEESDPIKDMGIGLTRHIQNIRKALKKMTEPKWEEEDYIEDEYVIKLDSKREYVDPDDFFDSVYFTDTWNEMGVFDPFEMIYYFDVNLEENIANRVFSIKNSNIEDWEWWDQKIISQDPISLTAEELVKLIQDDWESYDSEKAAIEAHELAYEAYKPIKTAKDALVKFAKRKGYKKQ